MMIYKKVLLWENDIELLLVDIFWSEKKLFWQG